MSLEPKVHNDDSDDGEPDYDPESQQVVGNWKKVDLPEVAILTGEEEEDVVVKLKSKLYRWRGEWKQRGVGELKILKHKKTGLARLIVRADATHRCILNHLLQQKEILCKLEPLKTSSTATAWTWACYDISDDKPQAEKMCVKFTNKDDFEKFRVEFEKGCADTALALSKKEQKTEEPAAETKKESPPAPANA